MSAPQPLQESLPHQESLQGVVERLTFHAEDSGFTIARLKVPSEQDLVTISGTFANIQPGQTLKLTGFWRDHPKYGLQFQVMHYQETKPATLTGLEKYLGSGLIKGVGPVTAKRIVSHFGLETLDVVEHQIERLAEVTGIAQKRVRLIQAAWESQKAIKEVMLFLQGNGVSTTYAVKIYKQYGQAAIATVTQNPYQLATDIYGIGFITADHVARSLGISPASEFRYQAGLMHTLAKAAEDGHCFLPRPELVSQSVQQLTLKEHEPAPEQIDQVITQMFQQGQLILMECEGQQICYQPAFFRAEQTLAKQLQILLQQPITVDQSRVQAWVERFMQKTGMPLSDQQQQAVALAASQPILILTGGPGCGKTFTTRAIVALWKAMGKTIALASPTGRAAQRLAEVAGQEAKTIHRLLEFDPKTMGFKRNDQNPIPADAIVIDEASMLDLFLAYSLVKAIAPGTQVLLVGDVDQLPSVGPGSVLRDMLGPNQIPALRLTQVFRQAQASQIVTHAHSINQGKFPRLEAVSASPQSDCLWLNAPDPIAGVQGIQDLVQHLIPQLEFQPERDVQVLCPATRGDVGTRNLNQVLQQLLNPPTASKAELMRGGMTLRVGDRVIQRVNDYTREVFNGDLGTLTAIDLEEQEVTVQFDQRAVVYDYADLNEIALAWAVTIHKSQGSEYPVVILPIFMQHYIMLSRNLIYTGLTRAKQLALLVGPAKAIGFTINQVKDSQRYTMLERLLQQR